MSNRTELELIDLLTWLVATLFFVVLDVWVTLWALDNTTLNEANPVIHGAIQVHGPVALYALKGVGITALVVLWWRMDTHGYMIPYWTAFFGATVTLWNLAVLWVVA